MRWRQKYRYAAAAVVIACFVPSARWFLWSIETDARGDIVSMARGRVSVFPHGAGNLAERIAAASADEGYLFYPDMPMMPFLTARRHVAKYNLFFPNYTTRSQYQEACVSAMRDATWVVIDRDWIDPRTLRALSPALRDLEPPEAKKFLQALETGFEFVTGDGAFEMRRRAAGVDDSVCDNVAQ
jgi:hypothetical protein